MPVDLDSSATFSDLILRLCERNGEADQTGDVAALPTDADVLKRAKRAVNEGYDRFLRSSPFWTFLEVDVDLTLSADGTGPYCIDGSPGRYRLPSYVTSSPVTPWRYADDQTYARQLQTVNPTTIDRFSQTGDAATGEPTMAAHRNRGNGAPIGQTQRGWELMVYPEPAANYVIRATFRAHRHVMTDLSERHICGGQHDAAIHAFAHWVWLEDDAENTDRAIKARDDAQYQLGLSLALDNANHPDSVGDVVDPSVGRQQFTARMPRVATHNGVAVPYGA